MDERTVSQRQGILVHPASIYLGLKTMSHLVAAGEKIPVRLVAATPEGRIVPEVTVDLALYRRTWQTVRRKGLGGYYNYISQPQDVLIERVRTRTVSQAMELDFTVPDGGFYFIAASANDPEGRPAASATGFYAYGGTSAGWQHFDHDRIDLVADRSEYAPGDTAPSSSRSFTRATGLLTVERDGVRTSASSRWKAPARRAGAADEPTVPTCMCPWFWSGPHLRQPDKAGLDPGKRPQGG